jgi:large subunit ribosomal protein L25
MPQDIPGHIDVDISALRVGDALHVSDLQLEGVEILHPLEETLVIVAAPRVEVEPAPTEAVPGAEAGPAEAGPGEDEE